MEIKLNHISKERIISPFGSQSYFFPKNRKEKKNSNFKFGPMPATPNLNQKSFILSVTEREVCVRLLVVVREAHYSPAESLNKHFGCALFTHTHTASIIKLTAKWEPKRGSERCGGEARKRGRCDEGERASGKLFKVQYCAMCRPCATHTHTHSFIVVDLLLPPSLRVIQLAVARSCGGVAHFIIHLIWLSRRVRSCQLSAVFFFRVSRLRSRRSIMIDAFNIYSLGLTLIQLFRTKCRKYVSRRSSSFVVIFCVARERRNECVRIWF